MAISDGAASRSMPVEWAFGAGSQAITFVSRLSTEHYLEHYFSYYPAIRGFGPTPGQTGLRSNTLDLASGYMYRAGDAVSGIIKCFECHSTGPVQSDSDNRLAPSQLGVRCEACHGPGRRHVLAASAGRQSKALISNPGRLSAGQLNQMCGTCHRATEDGLMATPDKAWSVRYQPIYFAKSQCFLRARGALSCLTCHDSHQHLERASLDYDKKCTGCHSSTSHRAKTEKPVGSCVECHMPRVPAQANLAFTNHWIGIYEQPGPKLAPTRRAVKALKASPVAVTLPEGFVVPASPATLAPVYQRAFEARERELGPNAPKVARAASDLGLFLMQNGSADSAEAPLRRAVAIDERNSDPQLDLSRENLAKLLEANGKLEDALSFFRAAAEGKDLSVAARALSSLGRLDRPNSELHYRRALAAEEKAVGPTDRRVAVILHELALSLREREDDPSAEPLLRRALNIQEKLAKPDFRLTVAIMNTLGNLIEGARRFDEAEKLERAALKLAEEKFGPESAELSMTCTNLADILWNKRDLPGAGQLYRRALLIDASLHGMESSETAADIANLGMVSKEAGQTAAGDGLLRQALAIYEKTLGPDSAQAKFVRQNRCPQTHLPGGGLIPDFNCDTSLHQHFKIQSQTMGSV